MGAGPFYFVDQHSLLQFLLAYGNYKRMGAQPNEVALEAKAAETLGVEIIPGTEVMTDVGDIHFTHAGGSANGSV